MPQNPIYFAVNKFYTFLLTMLFFSCVISFIEHGIFQQAYDVYVESNLSQLGDNIASQFCMEGKMMDIGSNFFFFGELNDTNILVPPIGIFKNILKTLYMCVFYII